MRFATLLLGGAAALQLGLPTRSPHAMRMRMQLPETDSKPAAEAALTANAMKSASSRPRGEVVRVENPVIIPNEQIEFTEINPEVEKANAAAPKELQEVIRRAEFWTNETCSILEVINVVGRVSAASDFAVRSEFTVAADREESLAQSGTMNRYEMAQRMGCTERIALVLNAPKLPFTNEKLAASVGMTCEEFNSIPVTVAATNVVYDALAESRSGLIPYAALDQRLTEWLNEDGSLNRSRFLTGLAKSRFVVIIAWFWFGKGNFVWVLLAAQALHDLRPDIFPTAKELGLDKVGFFV